MTLHRRRFLLGAGLSALLIGAPSILEARFPRGTPFTLSGFNGGRSQIQSNFIPGGGDYPFINLLKCASRWNYLDNTGFPTPAQADANGLPKNPVTNSGWQTSWSKPTATARPGNYYMVSTGTGVIAYQGGSFTPVSGVGTKTLISGAAIPGSGYAFYIQSTDASTPLSYLAICHEDDIAGVSSANLQSYIEAQIFSPYFISFLQSIRPAEVRFLNWQNGNSTNETSWASRKPETYWSYGTDRLVDQQFDTFLNCYVGWLGTAGGGNNVYAISDTSGSAAPADKQYITFKFPCTSVTCTSGANAQITWTAHGLTTGAPFVLFRTAAGSAPGGVPIFNDGGSRTGTITYFAIFIDANTIRFATTQANALAGTAVTTSSTGSGLLAQATIVEKVASSYSVPSSNITFSEPHLFAAGDSISLDSAGVGNTLPSNISGGGTYFAIASSPTVLQLASSYANAIAGTAITFTGSMVGTVTVIKNPQLNLNGTGNLPIKGRGGGKLNSSETTSDGTRPLARGSGFTDIYGTAVFDADFNAWLLVGSQDSFGVAAVTSGIPPEIALKLCARVGCHVWWVSPYFTLSYKSGGRTGLTDYMPKLMEHARDNKPSWMGPTIEGFNEDWNFITPGTIYSVFKAFVYWGIKDYPGHSYVGRYSSLLGQAAINVFGGAVGANCNVYVGVQGGTFVNAGGASGSVQRLAAAQFVSNGPTPPVGYTQSAAYEWCTHVGGANYYTTNLYATTSGTVNETQMTADWVAGGSLPNDPLIAEYVDGCIDSVLNVTISGSTMTVNSITSGRVYTNAMSPIGYFINGPGIAENVYQVVSGGSGGTGAYTLSGSPGNGSYTVKCGNAFTIEGTLRLAANYLAFALGTAQPGGKWGGVYQLKVKPYEGGYSPDLPGGTNDVRQFRWQSKFSPDSGMLINGGTLANGVAINGQYNDLITLGVERPSLFELAGGNGSGNPGAASKIWPLMDPDIYISTPPQMAAIIAFNH